MCWREHGGLEGRDAQRPFGSNGRFSAGVAEAELKKIDADARKIVAEASDFATADKEPDPSELYTDVLA